MTKRRDGSKDETPERTKENKTSQRDSEILTGPVRPRGT